MNLKQIAAFREVMRTGSVSEAARNLNRTQPAISHVIATLESDLGVSLFERRKGRLQPVPEAHYLLEECSELLNRLDSIGHIMRRIKSMQTGEFRIASMPGPSVFLLPDLISRHFGGQPDVRTTLLSRSSDAVQQLVATQHFDLGIVDLPAHALADARSMAVSTYRFECVCALSAQSPLARKRVLGPHDLDGAPMGTLYREHPSAVDIQRTFETAQSTLNVRFVTQFFIPLLTYVERGHASVLIDPLTVEAYRIYRPESRAIIFRRFEPVIPLHVSILRPAYRPASLLAKSFDEHLAKELRRLGGVPTKSSK